MGKKVRKQKTDYRGQKKRKWKILFRIPRFLIPKDEPIVPRAFTMIDYAGGILVFFICWAVYLHTLTPTIGFHDSGDMVTAAYVLGIPHPTGYPLYCLIGKLWMTILPIGNIAYRMNLASALCASLACMMVYFIVLKVAGGRRQEVVKYHIPHPASRIPTIVAALMLAFATTFWEQAVIAEKYTLNALFATLLIFILLKWAEVVTTERGAWRTEGKTQNSKLKTQNYLYLFAFTLGLSFTHHMQTIYLVPASIFFIITVCYKYRYSSLFTLHSSLKLLCLFILPLFLYLYLPIRANQNPPLNWGDPRNIERFINHISGQEYTIYFVSNISGIYKKLSYILHFLIDQFTSYLWWISIIGFLLLYFKRRVISLFFFFILLVNIIYSVRYDITNIEDYYIPTYIVFTISLSLCVTFIKKFLLKGNFFLKYLANIIFILFPIFSFIIHYPYNDRRDYYFANDYGRNSLHFLEKDAIVFPSGDVIIFPMWYLHYCENQSGEIVIIEPTSLAKDWFGKGGPWYSKMIKKRYPDIDLTTPVSINEVDPDNVIENVKQIKIKEVIEHTTRPVFITYSREIDDNYLLIPRGVLFKVMDKKTKREDVKKELMKDFLISPRDIKSDYMIFKEIWWTSEIIKDYFNVYKRRGIRYYNLGMYEKSIEEYENAIEIVSYSSSPPYFIPYGSLSFYNELLLERKEIKKAIQDELKHIHWSLGRYYDKKGDYLKAISEYKEAIKFYPNNVEMRNMLGYTYMRAGMYEKAIIEFEKAIKINPSDIISHMNLATVYYKRKLYKEAIVECNCILGLDSNNTYAKQMLEAISKKGK
ncbi:MAG: DUF2723 domain-containing protein [bacterium]